MSPPAPLYTAENCSFSCPLQWGVSAFWREPLATDDWLSGLAAAVEPDGIRVLRHRLTASRTSQFLLSTHPAVAPVAIVQRIKGRLQHLLRASRPRALRGNYAIRSLGKVTRETVENYIASQVSHHQFADSRFAERLGQYQIADDSVDLSAASRTAHGLYWYNLHLVFVLRNRSPEWHDEQLAATRHMIVSASRAKGYRLSRAGILPDHIHLLLGCSIDESPQDVALGFLNNLAFAQGMRPLFQFGAFIGTVGEYSNHAVRDAHDLGSHLA